MVTAECGTRVLFDLAEGLFTSSEAVLADRRFPGLAPEMPCLANRHFWSYERRKLAAKLGAALVGRTKRNIVLPCEIRFRNGSFLSTVYPSQKDRRHARHGISVRVVVNGIDGFDTAESVYRLVTNILDPKSAPAIELAALYHERRETENAFDEQKVHLRGRDAVLRSKTMDLVKQELHGVLLAHIAVRGLMYEPAESASLDSDDPSFVRSIPNSQAQDFERLYIPPQETTVRTAVTDIPERRVSSSRGRFNPRVEKNGRIQVQDHTTRTNRKTRIHLWIPLQ